MGEMQKAYFTNEVAATVKETVGANSPAIMGPLTEQIYFRAWDEDQLWPVGSTTDSEVAVTEDGGLPWWAWGLELLVLCCCCLLLVTGLYNIWSKPKTTKREAVAIADDDTDIDSGLEEAQLPTRNV